MSISKRQNDILTILSENVYVSVNELSKLLYTSPSSIRRDLTHLQNLGLAKRTHGGVSQPEQTEKVASFYKRAQKNVKEKRIIARKASALLKNGQSILLDSSTTASYMIPYIALLDNPIVFTNNLETAISAIKEGICTHCIGGCSINGSVALGGADTYRSLSDINVDIVFFSSQSLSKNGEITDTTEEENYVRQIMLKHAKKKVFLCDSTKFDTSALFLLTTLDKVDIAVFDKPFNELSTEITIL